MQHTPASIVPEAAIPKAWMNLRTTPENSDIVICRRALDRQAWSERQVHEVRKPYRPSNCDYFCTPIDEYIHSIDCARTYSCGNLSCRSCWTLRIRCGDEKLTPTPLKKSQIRFKAIPCQPRMYSVVKPYPNTEIVVKSAILGSAALRRSSGSHVPPRCFLPLIT